MRVHCPSCRRAFHVDERNRFPRVDCECGVSYRVVIPTRNGHRYFGEATTVLVDDDS
jgi:phosphoribosyl 1,2-cyclic phosphodiesterase